MNFSRKYFAFTIVMLICFLWKLNTWNDQYAAVETFRGAELKDEVFYPLMSKNLNDSGELTVYINDKIYVNNDSNVIIDNYLNPACSLDFIRDTLQGAAFQSDENSAVVQITDDIYEFLLDNSTATKNGDDIELGGLPSKYGEGFYIGLQDICDLFGYEYWYDLESYDIYITAENIPSLPKKFDLRNEERASDIRNQGSSSSCWACASLEALESSLRPLVNRTFSVDAMVNESSFHVDEKAGGEYTMALAYLLSWQGPKDDEEEKNILTDISGTSSFVSDVHLQEVHFYDSEELEAIKWAVYRYGGVSTSIYANVSTSNLIESKYYNKRTNGYCYTGSLRPNHDVVIIGWDDDFPASSFLGGVEGKGAFICQNSWGTGFGDNGVFYISYYDTNIGNQAVSYVKADTTKKYNYIYQSDLCGWVGQIGYQKEWMYGANIFRAEGERQIEAAGFYALGDNTSYEIYFVSNYENTSSFAKRQLVAEGSVENAGYYTIKFDAAKSVSEGEDFAIVLYISTPGTKSPMAIEYTSSNMLEEVELSDGRGFISNNGLDWENAEDAGDANLCIKAYGNDVVKVYE